MGGFIGGAVALVVGAALATVTVLGVIDSQTSATDQPVSRTIDYGTTN